MLIHSKKNTENLSISLKPFSELELLELYSILHLRDMVFVVGQKITSESEVDGKDPKCSHVLLYHDDLLVGTARLFLNESPIVVGRICILGSHQAKGYGRFLMDFIADFLGNKKGLMHAQAYLEGWYRSLGWKRVGEEYIEAEISHITMVYEK